jgi:hypothetical protein
MVEKLYVRSRGRVLGPFDEEKLRSLARQGQLSRIHEVSDDGATWVRAGQYPDLFEALGGSPAPADGSSAAAAVPQLSAAADSDSYALVPPVVNEETDGPGSGAPRHWWYWKNDKQTGPVDEVVLRQMLASGVLAPDDHVWSEGMPQWAPARAVAGLMPAR